MGALISKLKELFGSKRLELCLVGLENAGKTTLLNALSFDNQSIVAESVPTIGCNVKHIKKNGVAMKVWDLGGQSRFRGEWPRYTVGADCLVFCVDANDVDRIGEARQELHRLLEDRSLTHVPIAIVLTKIDLEPHLSKEQIVPSLNLDYISENPWVVIPISALHKINLTEIIDWLIKHSKS